MRQNRNFNFQNVSSANEKMLIILSWIIVVIIIVLIGLYYGQHTRDQEVTLARIDPGPGVEVSADAERRVEEGEMKAARETGSVLTDTLTLNRNELYTIQIGSKEDGDFLDDARAEELKREYSNKNMYAQKIISDPDRRQNILHIGLFKNYEEAKTFLNSVKLKNLPAKVAITVDPNSEIAFLPKSAPAKNASDVVVATSDARAVASVKNTPPPEDRSGQVQKIDLPPAGADSKAAPAPSEPAAPAAAETAPKKGVFTVKPEPPAAPPEQAVKETPPAAPAKTPSISEDTVVKTVKNTPDVKVVVTSKGRKPASGPAAGAGEVSGPSSAPAVPAAAEDENKKEEKKEASVPKATPEAKKVEPAEEPAEEDIVADESETAPAQASKSSPEKAGKFYIQLGTYKSSKNADILKKKVEGAGFSNVAIVPGKSPGGEAVYRVRLEGYPSKDAAAAESGKIRESLPEVTSTYVSK